MAQDNRFSSFRRAGFTLVEMIVTAAILTMLLGYAWKIYFGSRETMRNTLSQSQMQSEARWFFDQLARDVSAAYRFIEVDPDLKKFSFYSFQTSRRTLEDMFYTASGNAIAPIDQIIDVLKIEYRFENGVVKRQQTPGLLYFQRSPMTFSLAPEKQWKGTSNEPGTKDVLHSIAAFDVIGYQQDYKQNPAANDDPVITKRMDGKNPVEAAKISFIVLRVHNKIDERADRRDEELDLVCKFYSRVRLADAAYSGYFCSTDENGRF
ncbi:MAG: prepilin-type N-terminal cleavage/methylation domain-containing protein [Candidatus Riflebacteria bacterium]|nr:prepilin-type N-terminal cleavage/methylation domain-containing protein [Candidatus Riflebacteria bacterium]